MVKLNFLSTLPTQLGLYAIGVLATVGFIFFEGNFKLLVITQLLLCAGLIVMTKRVLFSLVAFLLFSASFITTGKYYTFQLVTPEAYYFEPLPFGIFEHFGLVVSDIFTFLVGLFLVRELVLADKWRLRQFLNTHIGLTLIGLSWLLFLFIALMTSLERSFYPEFSVVVVLQYSKLLIAFVGVMYLKLLQPVEFKKLIKVVEVIILTQVLVGFSQFFSQLLLNTTTVNNPYSYIIPEENFFFPRVRGSFNHANDFAFMLYKLGLVLLPFALSKKQSVAFIVLGLAVVGIILSQSRTVWLAVGIVLLFLAHFFWSRIITSLRRVKTIGRRYLYGLVVVGMIGVGIVGPRLYLSTFFFDDSGGGSLRYQMITEGVTLARERFWLGYGVGTQVKVFFNNLPQGYVYSFPYPIHNFYIWLLVETGLVGVGLFFLPFYLLLRRIFVKRSPISLESWIHIFLIIGILVYYGFQPSNGRVDFIFIGATLAMSYPLLSKLPPIYEKKPTVTT